ncbi:hypothetical protein ACIBUY_04205 [Streptomyces sp. NPDC050085]|uniref:hypothetical protein n=1 Tax=Streptomyces sp. NPDC050085 TaxID=3365600 RepID=UPI0037B4958D
MNDPQTYIGYHPEHGFIARPSEELPPHLADWLLTRVMFERVPDTPLYRLAAPSNDGVRRTRQAVKDLRALGFRVQADLRLDPSLSPDGRQLTPRPGNGQALSALRTAARSRSPQLAGAALSTPPSRPAAPAAAGPMAARPTRTR